MASNDDETVFDDEEWNGDYEPVRIDVKVWPKEDGEKGRPEGDD